MTPPYRVRVALDGDVWVIRAAGVHGEATASGLENVERIARKFIAMTTGTQLSDVRVLITVQSPGPAPRSLAKSLQGVHHGINAPWRWVRERLDHGP